MDKDKWNYKNRIEFLTAVMLKEYEKAIGLGHEILEEDPENVVVGQIVSLLETKKLVQNAKSNRAKRASTSRRGEKENSDTDTDTDSDVDNVQIDFGAKQFCQQNYGVNSKLKLTCLTRKYLTGEKENLNFNFKNKMYRVLPIKINRKKE